MTKTRTSTRRLEESHGQYAAVVYGRNANSNFPLLRLDYAVLATGGAGFVMWWDGGFNQDSTKCYTVDIDMDPFGMIDRAVQVCSYIIVTSAAVDEIERRGGADRLSAIQSTSFDSYNVTEASGVFGVHGYVVWGVDTNLEIPGCVIDFGSGPHGESFECFQRINVINQNSKQLLLARSDDPLALLRSARKRHSYAIITLRAMSVMQSRGLDLSSIRESTDPSEKRGVQSVREAARTLRTGSGNVSVARDTLIQYGFTPESLSEITMSRTSSTASLIARIDRLCEAHSVEIEPADGFSVTVVFDNVKEAEALQKAVNAEISRGGGNFSGKVRPVDKYKGFRVYFNVDLPSEDQARTYVAKFLRSKGVSESAVVEISTGALVWATKNAEEFPESRNYIGGSKGKYKARKVGQYGAKSLVNEERGDWTVFVRYMGDGSGPYDAVGRYATEKEAEKAAAEYAAEHKAKHPNFREAWAAMHPDAAMRDYRKRKGVSEGQVPSEQQTDDEIYDDCRGYCRNATDRQLRNIYADEKKRERRNPGETGRVAGIFAQAAKDEMEERGIDESKSFKRDVFTPKIVNGVDYARPLALTQNGAKFKNYDHIDYFYSNRGDRVTQRGDGVAIVRHRTGSITKYAALDGEDAWLEYPNTNETADPDYAAHATKLLQASTDAASGDTRHAGPWGLGYRTYLKTILRGDNPNNTKPKGDHLAGWNQARKDLASLDPMTEARKESAVSEALPAGVKIIKQKSLSGGSTAHQVVVDGRIVGEFFAGRDANGAYYTSLTDMRGRAPKPGTFLTSKDHFERDRNQMIQRLIDADKAYDAAQLAKKKASPNRVEMKGDKVVAVYVDGKLTTDHGVKIDSKADIRRGAVYDLEDKYNAEFTIVAESAVNEVAGYTLRDSDKKAVKAWVQQKPAEGKWVVSDGTTLRTTSLGAADMAKWIGGKPHIGMAYGNTTQTLINFIRKELRDQGMTTIGKLTTKGDPVADEATAYRTLNDAGKKIPDLSEGDTEVWFSKARTLDESTIRPSALPDTHVLVGKVKCSSPSRLFVLLQEEKWSPKGEASTMLRERGVVHSSMSVGDVIVTGGRHYMVAAHGFKRLDKQ